MNSQRHVAPAVLLLSIALTLPAAAAWAVPSFNLPEASLRAPRPYQGPKCQDANSQPAAANERVIVPFDHRNSPCRLEDGNGEPQERLQDEQAKPGDLPKKVGDWDGLYRHPREEQHSLPSPVPEADSYAMLLGGLSVLALLARRRQRRA